jgi:sodium transport system permease protein
LNTSDPNLRPRQPGFNWREVQILYFRELREAFREKAIVLNSLLIPVFLYPFLLWGAFTGLTFVMGQTEGFEARIVAAQWPAGHPGLRLKLEHSDEIRLVGSPADGPESAVPTGLDSIEQQIRNGQVDALVEFLAPTNTNGKLAGNFQPRITCNESRERSIEARKRLTDIIDEYRAKWLQREARRRGINPMDWQGFTLTSRNVASKKEMGAFLLGMIAPIIFVVMVAIGCFYPAVDATAGERERNTWETLMSCGAGRLSIVTAKYLYVATLGGMAGLLNLAAVLLTIKPIFAPLLAQAGRTIEFRIPWTALPVAGLAAALLAGFIAAGMMIFAAFARTFKEGQAMITPFYMLVLIPVVFLQVPGLEFSFLLACVPIVNVTLMVREAVSGVFHWGPMLVTVVSSLGIIAVCLRTAAFILKFEDVIVGSYNGSFVRFLQQRLLNRSRAAVRVPTTTHCS